jgi:hypothetical protein
MEGINTISSLRIIQTNGEFSTGARQAICAWISTEVRIEGTVFLHDDDNVLDLMNALQFG